MEGTYQIGLQRNVLLLTHYTLPVTHYTCLLQYWCVRCTFPNNVTSSTLCWLQIFFKLSPRFSHERPSTSTFPFLICWYNHSLLVAFPCQIFSIVRPKYFYQFWYNYKYCIDNTISPLLCASLQLRTSEFCKKLLFIWIKVRKR